MHEYSAAAEIDFITSTQIQRLLKFQKKIASLHIPLDTKNLVQAQTKNLLALCKNATPDAARTLQGQVAALLASVDWQSPSFLHSTYAEAGTQEGRIVGTVNDYKRDQHFDAVDYESAFRSQYIDAPLRLPPAVFLTNSGMAAFSTIISCLHMDGAANGPILAGNACYFQEKRVLENFFPKTLHFADETNSENFLAAVEKLQPAVIFLDTLCNTENIEMPDLKKLIPAIAKIITRTTTLVLDNTGLGPTYQPLADMPAIPGKLRLVVYESLLKYHQFGFDRISAGIMWTPGLTPIKLFARRMDLGTNISDTAALSLPVPNRKLLEARMIQIGSNARFLAHELENFISTRKTKFTGVSYPGLTPAQEKTFYGGCLVLRGAAKKPDVALYNRFIATVITEAKKQHIPLIAGSSFGFNTTRIYLTALRADTITRPFLRISAGTESPTQIKALAEIFKKALGH